MYRIFYAERDTTLYEKYPTQNTGIDGLLELIKIASGSKLNGIIQTNQYNTRFLIDFGSQITTISSSVAAGDIPVIGNGPNSASVYLTLTAADASDLLQSYDINAFPVSESWTNGNGYYSDTPITKYGASWKYRTSDDTADFWRTGSGELGTSETTAGGGSYITGSGNVASQSFQNQSPDIRMNVSDIVDKWVKGNIINRSIILKVPNINESLAINVPILPAIK